MKKRSVKEILIGVFFFCGFIGGILFVNLWGNTHLKEQGLLDKSALLWTTQTQIDARSLFLYLLAHRGKGLLLLWLLGYTAVGMFAASVFLAWLGFSAGVFAGLFVIRMHMMGVLIFLAAILPQALAYAPMVWILVCAVYEKGMARFRSREALGDLPAEKKYLRAMAVAAALFIVGLILESSANPWLLKQTVNYFL